MRYLKSSFTIQERKVSPPDLPPKEMYKTLGQLLQQIEQGHKFHPVTVKDVADSNNVSKVRLLTEPLCKVACTCSGSRLLIALNAIRLSCMIRNHALLPTFFLHMQLQRRTSNDGAESVEAKQDSEEARERGTDTGSNQDAESVTARDYLSPDDSDLEEGEIAGMYLTPNMLQAMQLESTCTIPV